MRTHWSTLADTIAEVESVGDKRGDAHAVVDTLSETLAVMEAVGESSSDAHALLESLADSLEEMKAKTLGDTPDDGQALDDTG